MEFDEREREDATLDRVEACNPLQVSSSAAFSEFLIKPHADNRNLLQELIRSEIIPELLRAHTSDQAARCVEVPEEKVVAYADLLLSSEPGDLNSPIDALSMAGVGFERLLIEFFTPVAQELGKRWEDDHCDFVDVTAGLFRLQNVLRDRASSDRGATPSRSAGYRAVFAAMPGDQHAFGAIVIEEMFARAGWSTERLVEADMSVLRDCLAGRPYDLLGITVSCDVPMQSLPDMVSTLRRASANERLVIMVGGPVFVANPELAFACGADGTASNALTAVVVADGLVEQAVRGRL